MQCSTKFLVPLLAVIFWLSGSTVEGGVMVMPPPGPTRIANADAVIVGQVEGIEPQDVKVGNVSYRIAFVKINEGLKGTKDAKTLRIGFIPAPKPGDGPKIIRPGFRPVQLQMGQAGLFILKKQDKEDFYTISGQSGYYINSENNKDFDKEVQVAKTAVKAMENPQASLKAKDVEERLLAATILIEQYRTYRGPKVKQEPIDAEESKQIMQALADSDWQTVSNFTSLRPNPMRLFQRLGVTANDGFVVPMGAGANYQAAAQTWIRENAEKYRIQRYVAADAK